MKTLQPIFILFFLTFSQSLFASDVSHTVDTFRTTPGTEKFFKQSVGYAVFPSIGKGGIGIGGAYGKGKVFRNGGTIGSTEVAQVTIGFQLGGQVYSQIIFFRDERALQEFTSGNFEFGAEAAAVALTAGVSGQVSTTGASSTAGLEQHDHESAARWYKGMAVFTIAKGGLMYQATIGGQKFNYTPNK